MMMTMIWANKNASSLRTLCVMCVCVLCTRQDQMARISDGFVLKKTNKTNSIRMGMKSELCVS